MIQRIQSIYLLISIICLSIVVYGNNVIIHFIGTTINRYQLTIFGIFDQEKVASASPFNLPIYLAPIVLIPLLIFTIFSYKNLKRQSLLINISIIIYLLLLIAIMIIYFFSDIKINDVKANVIVGSGFYILAMGLPFLFLANNGIKRDKKLIDSLSRLR